MVAQPLTLGPFTGGINNVSDAGTGSPNQLQDCLNFELLTDGSLATRPPITAVVGLGSWASNLKVLGTLISSAGSWLIGSTTARVYTLDLTDSSAVWTALTTFPSNGVVQYRDSSSHTVLYVTNSTTGSSGGISWDGSTVTTVAAIPSGLGALGFKDRLWVWNNTVSGTNRTNRLYYSKATDFTNWTAPDGGFIDVGAGDGQPITNVVTYNDALYIFKTHSTWVLTFSADPGDGSLRLLSPTVGAVAASCVAVYSNTIYLLDSGRLYALVNSIFTLVNAEVNFSYSNTGVYDTRSQQAISVVGDRLLVRYFDSVYVYYPLVGGWSRWTSGFVFGTFFRLPTKFTGTDYDQYVAGSAKSADTNVYTFVDGFSLSRSEAVVAKIQTKNLDLDIPQSFKRLTWWGADLATFGEVSGTLTIVTNQGTPSYADLASQYLYSQITGPYINPTNNVVKMSGADAGATNYPTYRKFVKFLRGIRFRTTYFSVELDVDSTRASQLYTIRAYIAPKSKVVDLIS